MIGGVGQFGQVGAGRIIQRIVVKKVHMTGIDGEEMIVLIE